MPLSLQCPRCNGSVSVSDQAAGKRVKCPHCDQAFLAPGVTRSQNDDDDWLQMDDPSVPPPTPVAKPPAEPASDSFFGDLPGNDLSGNDLKSDFDDFTSEVETPPAPKAKRSNPKSSNPEAAPIEYATEYRVKCKTCDSLMFAQASQAGKTVKCSDCFSPMTIPPPPKVRKKPKLDVSSAQTFQLEQPRSVRKPGADPMRKSAEQLLEEAARVEEESPAIRYDDTPDLRAWLAGVFGIFRDLGVISHWVGLSFVATVLALVVIVIDKPFFFLMLLPAGLFFAALVVSCGFAILQSVANEEEQVSEWPILDPQSWLSELVVAIAAAAVVGAPIAAVSHMLHLGYLGVAVTMFLIYGFFPFVLLSMMDMNTPWQPFSAEVARSVTKCDEAWGGFYFSSGLLFAALFLLIVSSGPLGLGMIGVVISIFATVGSAFIYFAMIGRLAYAIGQEVNGSPKRKKDKESTRQNDS